MEKKNIAVLLPGSYDPPTRGHLSLIEQAAREYERVYAVAFVNPQKTYTFTPEEREEMLRLMTAHLPSVTVGFSEGLVIDYARKNGISLLIKGYRNEIDLAYEKTQADWRRISAPRRRARRSFRAKTRRFFAKAFSILLKSAKKLDKRIFMLYNKHL